MNKVDRYRQTLRSLEDWEPFLLQESGLPGPRGNIELAKAVAEEGSEALFNRLLNFDPVVAPTNTPHEFLAFCGVLGLGRLASKSRQDLIIRIRALASDPRWRVREAVAMSMQGLGSRNMDALLDEMEVWSKGTDYERRAAAAAICEPKLLKEKQHALKALEILDGITAGIKGTVDRKADGFRWLRKGLGYCWSVAVQAYPDKGKPLMERWFESKDSDVHWVMKENLRKKRLLRTDEKWVMEWKNRLGMS